MNRKVFMETAAGEEAAIGTVGELLSPMWVDGMMNEARYDAANFLADIIEELAFGNYYEDDDNEVKLTIRLVP